MSKRLQADIVVIINIIGAVAAYIIFLHGNDISVAGAIIHGGFIAGTIGGLADWFAIKAIFGTPLGISYRTDILRRKRIDITNNIVDFITMNLFSPERLCTAIDEIDINRLLRHYCYQMGGSYRIQNVVIGLLIKFVKHMDGDTIADQIATVLSRVVSNIPLESSMLDNIASIFEEQKQCIVSVLVNLGEYIVSADEFREFLITNIESVRRSYEADGIMRGFVLSFFDNEMIADAIADNMRYKLSQALIPQSPEEETVTKIVLGLLADIKQDNLAENLLNSHSFDYFKQAGSHAFSRAIIEKWQQIPEAKLEEYANLFSDKIIAGYFSSTDYQIRFKAYIKSFANDLIGKYHKDFQAFVRASLQKMSDDEFVGFVEKKVENDLQMIRINGAVIGAVVGMLLTAMTILAERLYAL